MNYPKYHLANTPENTRFSFISTGPKGDIELTILFTLDDNGFYQIALGPLKENDEIDDLVVVDNGDRNKILATVQMQLSLFLVRTQMQCSFFRKYNCQNKIIPTCYFIEFY